MEYIHRTASKIKENFFMKGILDLREISEMDKEMEEEQNMIKMLEKDFKEYI